MRLAAFGGVYANEPALDAVLADIGRAGADLTWCLGDLAGFGPHPDRAIARVREQRIKVVQGNVDDAIARRLDDCACGYTDPRDRRFAQISYDHSVARTSAVHAAWLGTLPADHTFEAAGRRVRLCHGSPRRVNEFLWESDCPDAFLEWLCARWSCDVLLVGHTGIPWHRALPSGRHVVNVGAVGRPANDGRPGAWYALLELGHEPRVELRHVAYDHERVAFEVEAQGLPGEFAETLRTGWWTTCVENLPARERRRGRH